MKDNDFKKIIYGHEYVLLRIYYYIPDYNKLINEFIWQTIDMPPRYPRINNFLDFWRKNIDAVIKEVEIVKNQKNTNFKNVSFIFNFNKLM